MKKEKNIIVNKPEDEDKEFPAGKDNYCPICYFEDDKVILRKNCKHNNNKPKKYQIIYADPPWDYWMGKEKGKWLQGVANKHYSTMKNKDICDLPVESITDENCILFLWATFPKLPEVLEVIKAWGFEYKTIGFVWLKTTKDGKVRTDGIGWYTTSNAEICLIAKKGKLSRQKTGISQIVYYPRTKHSQKPPEVRNRIVELMGGLPRIELFARQKTEGWDVWGNEVKSDIEL